PPAAPAPPPGAAAIPARQFFRYLSYAAGPGDWVRYRVQFPDGTTVEKTVGFGSERVAGTRTLFIETRVRTEPVSGLLAGITSGVGTDAVLKTYVAGSTFG